MSAERVLVTRLRTSFDPSSRELEWVPWSGDCTARKLAPEWCDVDKPWGGVYRNGIRIQGDDLDRTLSPGDNITFALRPGFEPVSLSLVTGIFPAIQLGTVPGIVAAGIILANGALISFAIQALLGPSRKPTEPGDESSSNFLLGLQTNADAAGAPIPVVYGRHRVTPLRINQYTRNTVDSNGDPQSELVALYLIGEGPVHAIGDKTESGGPFSVGQGNALQTLQINSQPAENFVGVEAWVRLGDVDQDPVPGLANAVLQFSVGSVLTESPTVTGGGTVEATPGVYASGHAEITKWDAVVAYTMGDEADEFTAVVTFLRGLVRFNGSGSAVNNQAQFQIRYRQVDSGGTPFGNYIVLPPEPIVQAKKTAAFSVNFTHRFFDSASYVPPQPGRYLDFPSSNVGASYLIDSSMLLTQGLADTEFTLVGWIRPTNNVDQWVFQWIDPTTSKRGFALGMNSIGGTNATFTLYTGNGTAISSKVSNIAFGIVDSNWHMVSVSLKADANTGGDERVRFYVDGTLIDEDFITRPSLFDFTATMRFGSDGSTANGFVGRMDGIQVFQRELSTFEVAAKYNGGQGVPGSADEDKLIVGARFDAEVVQGGIRYATDVYGPGTNAALPGVLLGVNPNPGTAPSVSTGGNYGPVPTPEQGTEIRGRFLVEAIRIDDSDEGENNAFDEATWSLIQLTTFDTFEFPGMALLGIRVPIQEQIGSQEPLVTIRVEGRPCPVWDGVDPLNPSFVETWTRNPAWIALDHASSATYGMGAYYDLRKDFALVEWQAFSEFCDELVYNGAKRLRLLSIAPNSATSTDIPNGSMTFLVPVDGYPRTWPGAYNPLVSGYHSGVYLRVYDIDSDGSAPSWLTDHDGDTFEVYSVEIGPSFVAIDCHNTEVEIVGGYSPPDGTIQVEQVEPRMQFDSVFDRRNASAWDTFVQILRSARASPLQAGARLGVHFDAPRDAVALFGMGAIREGSFETSFVGVDGRYNQETVEFWDEALDYERDEEGDEHPSLNDPTSASAVVPRRINLEGVCRRSQVRRHLRRDLNSFHLLRAGFKFRLGLDAIAIRAGDVIDLAHDLPGFGASGRCWQDSSSLVRIYLDRPVTIEAATSYVVEWQSAAANTRETVDVDTTVSTPGTYEPGEYLTLVAPGFSSKPKQDDQYSFGKTSIGQVQKVQIVKTTIDPSTMEREVTCAVYDEQVYEDDFGTLQTAPSTLLQSTYSPETEVPVGVVGLVALEETSTGPDGSVSTAARLSFTHHQTTYHAVRETNVFVARGSSPADAAEADLVARVPASRTSILVAYPFERDQDYVFFVQPVGRSGASTHRSYATWVSFRPDGLAPPPPAPANLRAATVGESASYGWDEHPDLDRARSIELRRGGWILGLPVHAGAAQAREIGPTPDWVGLPTNSDGLGAVPLYARAKLGTGQYGPASSLFANQDAPGSGRHAIELSMEDESWAGTLSGLSIVSGDREYLGRPGARWRTTDHLEPSGGGLVHSYEVTPDAFGAPESVFVQIGIEAVQIRPETTEELSAAIGSTSSNNALRWTAEGPTLVRGDELENCSAVLEIAYSDTASPGSDWRTFRPGRYRLRSCKLRLTVTRPTTTFGFRISRFAVRITWQGHARVSQATNRLLLNI